MSEKLEHNREKEIFKRLVGRPKKGTKAVLFKPKIKSIPSTKKVRGSYTNWFTPSFWPPPIYATIKQHRNIFRALKYLRATYRKPRKIDDVYDYLSRTSLAKWFHPNGELEENYKRYVGLGTTFASAQHSPILDAQLVLKEEICEVLKKHRAARQPLSVVCIQPVIKAIILKRAPHLLKRTHMTAFHVSYAWTKSFIKSQLNWSYQASTIATSKLPKD